jgi:hypothetical protein
MRIYKLRFIFHYYRVIQLKGARINNCKSCTNLAMARNKYKYIPVTGRGGPVVL